MPVPSLPPRTPRDNSALPGRDRPIDVASGPAGSGSTSDADAVFSAAFPATPLSPAVLAEDGRGVVASMHETRDRATRIAESLEWLDAAGAGLARVQQLVGQLRDATVVALDRTLQPADRAALQRQVDLALTEIDTVADGTRVDEAVLQRRGWADAPGEAGTARLTPFRALSTGTLGVGEVTVRSSDQALAAVGALDVATARLERTAGTLGSVTSRLRQTLHGLVNPSTSATGETPIASSTTALGVTILLRSELAAHPQEAAQAQGGLDVSRVRWLLDSPLK